MPSITTLLRSLGNDGAVANARSVLDVRHREDWLVAGLAGRLAAHERREALPAAPERRAGAA